MNIRDPSMAGLPTLNLRALLVGTMTSEGTAEPDIPVIIGTQHQADAQFGMGSELARMVRAFFKNRVGSFVEQSASITG